MGKGKISHFDHSIPEHIRKLKEARNNASVIVIPKTEPKIEPPVVEPFKVVSVIKKPPVVAPIVPSKPTKETKTIFFEPEPEPEPEPEEEDNAVEEEIARLESLKWNDFRSEVRKMGILTSGGRDVIMERVINHLNGW